MGNTIARQRIINFEDIQNAIQENALIINTLPAQQQHCLIAGTLSVDREVEVVNTYLKQNIEVQIILYGMNATDETCLKKYEQLMKLGFYNVYMYGGGLFEWLLLQDVYGAELFPTTSKKVDILKYKGRRQLRGVSTPLTPHYG